MDEELGTFMTSFNPAMHLDCWKFTSEILHIHRGRQRRNRGSEWTDLLELDFFHLKKNVTEGFSQWKRDGNVWNKSDSLNLLEFSLQTEANYYKFKKWLKAYFKIQSWFYWFSQWEPSQAFNLVPHGRHLLSCMFAVCVIPIMYTHRTQPHAFLHTLWPPNLFFFFFFS